MSFATNVKLLKEQSATANVGMKWTTEENAELMQQAQEGMPLDEIAKKHQRTVGGVRSHIMLNAVKIMAEQHMSIEDAADIVNMSVEDLANYKRRKEEKKTLRQEQKEKKQKQPMFTDTISPGQHMLLQQTGKNMSDNTSNKHVIDLLTEIRDYLKIIAEK